jgi:hypothetical protein
MSMVCDVVGVYRHHTSRPLVAQDAVTPASLWVEDVVVAEPENGNDEIGVALVQRSFA